MSEPILEISRARTEAASWIARLSQRSVTTDALQEFRAWRQDPANAAAYAEAEATWNMAGELAGDPQIRAATAEILQRRPKSASLRSRFGLAPVGFATAAVVCAIAAAGWITLQPQRDFRTRVGEQRLIVLNDGSRVRLNTDSEIHVRYVADQRRVVLARGEAFFEAAHDATRPFVVEADGAQVRALGTKFDVRKEPLAVQVTLLEGRVEVAKTNEARSATLAPNQQLTVTKAGISPARVTDASEASGWTSGHLSFRATSLQDAVAEVNRYGRRKIILDGGAALAQQPVSGVFDVGDTDAFVAAVTTMFPLDATRATAETIRLVPRSSGPHA